MNNPFKISWIRKLLHYQQSICFLYPLLKVTDFPCILASNDLSIPIFNFFQLFNIPIKYFYFLLFFFFSSLLSAEAATAALELTAATADPHVTCCSEC